MKQVFLQFFIFSIINNVVPNYVPSGDTSGVPVEIMGMINNLMNKRDPGGDADAYHMDGNSQTTGSNMYNEPGTGAGSSGNKYNDGSYNSGTYNDGSYEQPDKNHGYTFEAPNGKLQSENTLDEVDQNEPTLDGVNQSEYTSDGRSQNELTSDVSNQSKYTSDGETLGKSNSSGKDNTEPTSKETSKNKKNNFSKGDCKEGNIPTVKKFLVTMNQYTNDFEPGQCTEWVDGRIYQTKGVHINFLGDAYTWNESAKQDTNWGVSNTPSVGSIMVFEPGAQNTSAVYGHVAFVESFSGDTICTSNWNAPTLGHTTYINYKNGEGVSFISYRSSGGGDDSGVGDSKGKYDGSDNSVDD